jgi:NTP pyrophosphatase (non-canonical NTP hydrolase)
MTDDNSPVAGQSLSELALRLREFAAERDWDQFHSPKNLSMALAVEVSELMEHFQWLTEAQSLDLPPEKLLQAQDEIADVLIYLTRLSDRLGIDPVASAFQKLETNRLRYPADKVFGSAKKHSDR